MKARKPFLLDGQLLLFDPTETRRYVVHAHKTRFGVHYDFRFEFEGDLIDYCLPHGFSVNPRHVRRALEQPRHDLRCLTMPEWCSPTEGGDKEVMMRWDEGSLRVLGDPEIGQLTLSDRGLREGNLRIELTGVKLNGIWLFARDRRAWTVRKEADEFASSRNILRENWSVLTRRPFPLVAAEPGIHDGIRFVPMAA